MRKPANKNERDFTDLAERKNWKWSKRGWPDFFCIDENGTPCVVEVKPRLQDGRRMKKLKKRTSTYTRRTFKVQH